MIAAGELNRRVTLQRNAPVRSGAALADSWSDVGTYWAKVRPIQGRELFQAMQTQSEVTYEVDLRRVMTVNPADRVTFTVGGIVHTLNVVTALQDFDAHETHLLCKELNAQ